VPFRALRRHEENNTCSSLQIRPSTNPQYALKPSVDADVQGTFSVHETPSAADAGSMSMQSALASSCCAHLPVLALLPDGVLV